MTDFHIELFQLACHLVRATPPLLDVWDGNTLPSPSSLLATLAALFPERHSPGRGQKDARTPTLTEKPLLSLVGSTMHRDQLPLLQPTSTTWNLPSRHTPRIPHSPCFPQPFHLVHQLAST